MAQWTRKPQEQEGRYFFAGVFYVTQGVAEELAANEITAIYLDVRDYVHQNNGADFLFVYADTQGRKLFFIDNLNKEMKESGQYQEEDDYCTLMFAHEY